jgi:AcrR family transcriptional regulator
MSPRTQAQNAEIREQSRQKILDAALKLFALKGFDGTSVSGIAKEAGVAKGLIYNYFESKEEIVHQIVVAGVEESASVMVELMGKENAREKLRFSFNLVRRHLKERFEYNKLLNMLALKLEAFPELQDFVVAKYNGFMPLFSSILAEIGVEEPEREARMLAATMDGISTQYLVLKEKFPLDQMIDELIEKYCH